MSWYQWLHESWSPVASSEQIETALRNGDSGAEFRHRRRRYEIDFRTMATRDARGAAVPVLRDRRADAATASPLAEVWEWQDRHTWVRYSHADSELLSLIAATDFAATTIRVQDQEYQIDTRRMLQINIRTGFRRSIRRGPWSEPQQIITAGRSTSAISSSEVDEHVLRILATATTMPEGSEQEQCPICLCTLTATNRSANSSRNSSCRSGSRGTSVSSNGGETNDSTFTVTREAHDEWSEDAVKLPHCSCPYHFHRSCIQHALRRTHRCPMCRHMYLPAQGDQPGDGEMRHELSNDFDLPGHEGAGTIVINYSFPAGIQGPAHPHPGVPYSGTCRRAFLPNTAEGREVLQLLLRCFQRRLTFTVGTSLTTGRQSQIVWNGVHHKTRIVGGAANFAWPDETYFTRVKEELSAKGIH